MTYEKISELLNRFWEGETDLAEEQILKNYFADADSVDARLEKFRAYFSALKKEQSVSFQPAAGGAKIVSMSVAPRRFSIYKLAAAASLVGLLATGAWWFYQQKMETQRIAAARELAQKKLYEDTFDTPEEAAAEIKAALALVSSKMRKGKREAAKGLGKMKKVDKYLPTPN